ncbi:MAG: CotH kinase family protein [Kiritimatiellae bacterium]|nr:CotH kinase family protein [Kiritimatiellia bacterium]
MSAGALLGAMFASSLPWFGVDFSDYRADEALSDKGAYGGSWGSPAVPSGTVVTARTTDAGFPAMALQGGLDVWPSLTFVPETVATNDLVSFDIRFSPGEAMDFGSAVEDCKFLLTFVAGARGGLDVAVVVAGRWTRLCATGLTFETDGWYDLRVILKEIGGEAYLGVAVKTDSGYEQLAAVSGVKWIPVDREAMKAIAGVSIAGDCQFSGFMARQGELPVESVAKEWVGGTDGEWNAATNWSDGRVPATGELVRLAGPVALERNGETATLAEALVRPTAEGALSLESGTIRTELEMDFSRPRVGVPLGMTVRSFAGITPPVELRWLRSEGTARMKWDVVSLMPTYSPAVADREHWLKCEATDALGVWAERDFFFSRLPVVYLSTDDGKAPMVPREEHAGHLYAQGNEEWKSPYEGAMTIKVRGNSTAGYAKKPWKIKLDEKTKMFGIPKSKHWVLLANYLDPTQMRDKLAYDFANEIGQLGMKSTWVECVLNGEWQGCYLFCEHLRIAQNRVDIFDWEEEAEARGIEGGDKDFSWVDPSVDDLSGGYLFEFDYRDDERSKFTLSSGNLKGLLTKVVSPEYLSSNPTMMTWCQDYLQNYFDACTSFDGTAAGRHYSEYCDVDSMVSYFLVMEMCGNWDARSLSRFAYKDRGKLLKFGPVWDFDYDMGNPERTAFERRDPERWLVNDDVKNAPYSFYKEWADDPWFCTLLWTAYPAARAKFVEMIAKIDEHAAYLSEAGEANARKWPRATGTFTSSIAILKAFLTKRLAWMDRQFRDVPTLMASLRKVADEAGTPSTHPYSADVATLPLAFVNAPAGTLREGQSLKLAFALGDVRVADVGFFMNGLNVGTASVTNATVEAVVPFTALTAAKGDPNCLSLIAYDGEGAPLARNFALVTVTDWDETRDATPPTIDGSGNAVPSVPHQWIRDAAVAVRPSLAWATAEEFAQVILETPSPWGKSIPLWQDYVAGTIPTDPNDRFRITSFARVDGKPRFTYSPDLGERRVYTVVRVPSSAPAELFKIKVELPFQNINKEK